MERAVEPRPQVSNSAPTLAEGVPSIGPYKSGSERRPFPIDDFEGKCQIEDANSCLPITRHTS